MEPIDAKQRSKRHYYGVKGIDDGVVEEKSGGISSESEFESIASVNSNQDDDDIEVKESGRFLRSGFDDKVDSIRPPRKVPSITTATCNSEEFDLWKTESGGCKDIGPLLPREDDMFLGSSLDAIRQSSSKSDQNPIGGSSMEDGTDEYDEFLSYLNSSDDIMMPSPRSLTIQEDVPSHVVEENPSKKQEKWQQQLEVFKVSPGAISNGSVTSSMSGMTASSRGSSSSVSNMKRRISKKGKKALKKIKSSVW